MLHVHELTKNRGGHLAVDHLTLRVEAGEVYGLLGPNGSGKTTTISMVCGLLPADGGTVRIEGGKGMGRPFGLATQEVACYRDLTPRENLRFFGRMQRMAKGPAAARADELVALFRFGQYADVPAGQLSGGWQRRLHVAIAFVSRPGLVVLDEPTAGLDVDARMELWEVIRQVARKGAAILVTTHDLGEAERYCDRIGLLDQGRLAAEGTVSELRRRVPAARVAEVESSDEPALLARAAELGWEVRRNAGRLALLLPQVLEMAEVVDRFRGVPLTSLSIREIGLEQIWVEVTCAARDRTALARAA